MSRGWPGSSVAPSAGDRTRAGVILAGIAVVALLLVVGLAASLAGFFSPESSAPADAGPRPTDSANDAGAPGRSGDAGSGPAAEARLARAPMLDLPISAVSPRRLSTRTAGPPITLPEPEQAVGTLVPTGFPETPEGGLAQLVELMRVGVAGYDPQSWARAYASLTEPGAVPPTQTRVSQDMVDLRRGANFAPTGPLRDGMRISWTPTSAMVKGTTADGSYTVACVLGEFVADYDGRVVTAGYGTCLPMRRVDDQWRVASGPTAAAAPLAWPGSDEAVSAGWRDIRR